MTIETVSLVEEEGNTVGRVSKTIRKKRCRRTKQLSVPRQRVSMPLQKLFVSCQEVFKGPGTVPLPCGVEKLCQILDIIEPEDVGLNGEIPFFKSRNVVKGPQRVTCATIYKSQKFSLCIFFLPQTAVIPLHNHPGMTVFNKLLLGSMHIKSYDWVDSVNINGSTSSPDQQRLAKLKADTVFTAPCKTSVLYPTSGGNIHAFTAATPCAFLDVLGPPYSKEDGRDCIYYRDLPYSPFPGDGGAGDGGAMQKEGDDRYGWLEEIEMPKDSKMDIIEYMGPKIIETS